MKEINFGPKEVKEFGAPFIIADVGANSNGDLGIAKEMIERAGDVGIDSVKFQSWTKDTLMSSSLYKNQPAGLESFGPKTQGDLLDFLSLTDKDHYALKAFCDKNNVIFSSTPLSFHHVDLLNDLDVLFFKIASMDLNHLSMLEYVAKKGKPIILSTGMGSVREIGEAIDTILSAGNDKIILLHCTSLYPPTDEEVNLNNIDYLRNVFDLPIGYSDHTLGINIPLASVAKGVCVIEKHYTLDKTMEGWDHAVSGTPEEFRAISSESKRIVKALGNKMRVMNKREIEQKDSFRRSIVAKNDLTSGRVVEFEDLDFKRPGTGIHPNDFRKVINRKLARDLKADELFQWDCFE